MLIYRIARRPHVDLSGLGGLYAAGRWHHKGLRIIYASQNLETALLEIAINNYLTETQKSGEVMEISIPDPQVTDINDMHELLEGFELDNQWRSQPHLVAQTRRIGTQWLKAKISLALRVPSIVVDSPSAYNYLINPDHPMMHEVTYKSWPLTFDQRLIKTTKKS